MKLVVLLGLLFTTLISLSEEKETVVIQNAIPGGRSWIHCFSSDDDLGYHMLGSNQTFSFRFNFNFFGTTKFYCLFKTFYGFGTYGVFTDRIYHKCGSYCLWSVTPKGPCLHCTEGELYCQPWKDTGESLLEALQLTD